MIIFFLLLSITFSCPDTEFCTQCQKLDQSRNKCLHCEDSIFSFAEGKCIKPSDSLPNCKLYEDSIDLSCSYCESGFRLTSDKKCEKCS